MKISARNVFEGEVKNIEIGAIMSNVKIEVTSPEVITAIITKESVEKLGLKEGDKVSAIIKSTEVMVAKD
ncbi:molybdenum-pterin binding protein [Methanobacterium lacus]|jgi:molybdopterin-binding protein|uniref:Molybdenum-pterin binding protein n=1 Tax=Methanobacterium lacus (strain AL-21) TaxID=877455 RepID=F0T779_METLA|nr:TOBE domain-containing protein [Methanobacterium lacus]ADZ10713.1 molybdenum-pterin binding protein [Methanobacterium lacus]UTB33996.1 MAG: TOBE domain-containing protein [Methanobacterium sp. ERen5]